MTATQDAIRRAATAAGIDPSAALAIAERESNFDPTARSSKTIAGMYQMRGDLRRQYGVGDSADPETQAKGWTQFFNDNKGEMARVLGRTPTDAEGYLGHHFGATRAARMMKMDPDTPVDQVFTPYERSINPHFDKAGTVGNLNSTVLDDIGRRQAKYGGQSAPLDFSSVSAATDAQPAKPLDFSTVSAPVADTQPQQTATPQQATQAAPAPLDFNSVSTPAT